MSTSSLSPTAKVIAQTIDGASERAVLISGSDGTVLHRNEAADRFLFKPSTDDVNSHHLVTDFMILPEDVSDWRTLDHCRVVMATGKETRNERYIHWVHYDNDNDNDGNSDTDSNYRVAYICSKHERVREIVDTAFDPVVTTNEDGTIRTANDAAKALFGYTEAELIGSNVSQLCGGGHADKHAGYLKKYQETGVKHIVGQKREVMGRKKDGSEFFCELGIQEISDVSTGQRFFCGFFKDLTLLKEHEAQLRERQALVQGMIDASLDSMLEIDQEGIIQIVNDAACHMFGYSREEFIGSNISIICGGGHAEKHASYMQRYLETGEKRIIGVKRQVKARRKDGSELEVELAVREVLLASGEKAFCGFVRDLTAQKKDKRALRKQQQLIHGKFFGETES
ncbi:MAG: hypothetical protein SGBAC_004149 [Bacillariaceae sp.]